MRGAHAPHLPEPLWDECPAKLETGRPEEGKNEKVAKFRSQDGDQVVWEELSRVVSKTGVGAT